jgi:hypothetical protein
MRCEYFHFLFDSEEIETVSTSNEYIDDDYQLRVRRHVSSVNACKCDVSAERF